MLVPAGATAGDTLTVTTEVGNFELAVPADVGRTLFADLPVPPDCQLSTLKVSKLLLNGQELVKAAPPSAAAIGAGGTRRVVVPMQNLPNAQPGHTLALQTEVGVFQVVVPDGWRSWKPLAVDLAVPDDYSAPGLTIAWAKLVDDLSPAALVGSTPPRSGTSPGGRVRYASCPEDPAELGILGTREQVLAAIKLQGAVRAHLSGRSSLRRRGHLFKVQESPAREAAARGGSPAARRAAAAAPPGASWAENWDGPPGLAELCVAMQQVVDTLNRSLSRCMAVL